MLVTFYIVPKCLNSYSTEDTTRTSDRGSRTNIHIIHLCHKARPIPMSIQHPVRCVLRTVAGGYESAKYSAASGRLCNGCSPQSLTFDPGPVHVKHKWHWEGVPSVQRLLRISLVSLVPSVYHTPPSLFSYRN